MYHCTAEALFPGHTAICMWSCSTLCESWLSACPATATSRIFCLFTGEATEGEAAAQEYHVEEPDQSASEAEEPPPQPKGHGRSKKTGKAPIQGQISRSDM